MNSTFGCSYGDRLICNADIKVAIEPVEGEVLTNNQVAREKIANLTNAGHF